MNLLHAIDKDLRRELAALRRENRRLRKQVAELDAQARKDRQALGAALFTVADRNAEIESIRRVAEGVRKITRKHRSPEGK